MCEVSQLTPKCLCSNPVLLPLVMFVIPLYYLILLKRMHHPISRKQGPIRLTPSIIPDSADFDVKDSSFFKRWDTLPSPDEVRSQAYVQHVSGTTLDERRRFSITGPHVWPPPVLFKHMGLVLKWGVSARISEAQTLYAIRRLLDGGVPVPEVYGWRTRGDEHFIYMEYIPGQTLEKAWDIMEEDNRSIVCRELRMICDNIRQLQQEPSDNFVGKLSFIWGLLPLRKK